MKKFFICGDITGTTCDQKIEASSASELIQNLKDHVRGPSIHDELREKFAQQPETEQEFSQTIQAFWDKQSA